MKSEKYFYITFDMKIIWSITYHIKAKTENEALEKIFNYEPNYRKYDYISMSY